MARCTMPNCGEFVDRKGLCTRHYMQQYRGLDPQRFVRERERLKLRVGKGTGGTGTTEGSRSNKRERGAEGRAAIASAIERGEQAPIKLAYVKFMDPAFQKVKT